MAFGHWTSIDVDKALKQPRSEVVPEHAVDGRPTKVVEGDEDVLEVAHHHVLAEVVLAVAFVVGAGTPVAIGLPPLSAPPSSSRSLCLRLSYRSNTRKLDSHLVPIFTSLLTTTSLYRWARGFKPSPGRVGRSQRPPPNDCCSRGEGEGWEEEGVEVDVGRGAVVDGRRRILEIVHVVIFLEFSRKQLSPQAKYPYRTVVCFTTFVCRKFYILSVFSSSHPPILANSTIFFIV